MATHHIPTFQTLHRRREGEGRCTGVAPLHHDHSTSLVPFTPPSTPDLETANKGFHRFQVGVALTRIALGLLWFLQRLGLSRLFQRTEDCSSSSFPKKGGASPAPLITSCSADHHLFCPSATRGTHLNMCLANVLPSCPFFCLPSIAITPPPWADRSRQ